MQDKNFKKKVKKRRTLLICYPYRTKRKGAVYILPALEKLDRLRETAGGEEYKVEISVKYQLSFCDLLREINKSDILVDNLNGLRFGYLSLIGFFAGKIIFCGHEKNDIDYYWTLLGYFNSIKLN